MITPEQITKKAKVIVPEHWNNNRKGKFWEQLVADLLRKQGFRVEQRLKFIGMEVDCLAYNPKTHQRAYIECKFQKKLIDSDIVDKMLGKAGRLEVNFAYLFSTSEAGSDARGVIYEEDEKNKKNPDRKPRLIFVSPEDVAQLFMDIKGIALPDLTKKNIGCVKILTLLISPEQILWVAEEIERDEPCRAIVFPTSDETKINIDELCADLSRLNLWQGIEIVEGNQVSIKADRQAASVLEIDKDVVSPIGVAESFEHYQRPCRPQDFIGRPGLREKFWDFVKNVRNGKALTRIFCFSGRSGLGKSSLVLRLAEDCLQNKKYRKNYYFYHVDVRSAKSVLFVVSAIRTAIQKAIDDEFIEISEQRISIESTEQPLFSSQSIRLALEKLKSSRRVLIIFFDQFEEIFTKESLFGVYELFEKAAHEVASLKENIVLGFCWRTGIIMPDGHKAYHLWHGLTDKRIEFEVKNFLPEESLELLNQFDNHLRKRRKPLERKLKRWLLDHCPGFPWLLRKVCSDIYNQILSESEIIPGRQINIKELFDKDLERYITTGEQEACLKYIAHHSPISMNEVIERFGGNVIQCLEDNRLIIRTGINYTIYWDIFREYIIEGKVPTIPLSYRPRNRIPTVLDIFRVIGQEESKKITLNELLSIAKQKKPTIQSIVLDLQNICLVTYKHDLIEVHPKLVNAGDLEIANYLENQLEEHVVIREVYKQTQPGKLMTLWGFQKLVAKAYCIEDSQNKKTAQDYASRMLSWFLFAGLLEKQQNKLLARPIGEGKQKGKPLDCVLSVSQEDTELPLLQLLG
jgi:predicted transcriptional regulator